MYKANEDKIYSESESKQGMSSPTVKEDPRSKQVKRIHQESKLDDQEKRDKGADHALSFGYADKEGDLPVIRIRTVYTMMGGAPQELKDIHALCVEMTKRDFDNKYIAVLCALADMQHNTRCYIRTVSRDDQQKKGWGKDETIVRGNYTEKVTGQWHELFRSNHNQTFYGNVTEEFGVSYDSHGNRSINPIFVAERQTRKGETIATVGHAFRNIFHTFSFQMAKSGTYLGTKTLMCVIRINIAAFVRAKDIMIGIQIEIAGSRYRKTKMLSVQCRTRSERAETRVESYKLVQHDMNAVTPPTVWRKIINWWGNLTGPDPSVKEVKSPEYFNGHFRQCGVAKEETAQDTAK